MFDVFVAKAIIICFGFYVIYETCSYSKRNIFFSYGVIFRVVFFTVYVASAIVHLYDVGAPYRGFFDSYQGSIEVEGWLNTCSASVIVICYMAFLLASNKINYYSCGAIGGLDQDRVLFIFGSIFFTLGVIGILKVAGTINLFEIERGRAVPPGLAKYIFMAQWLVWGITFLYAAILRSNLMGRLSPIATVVALLLIVLSVLWMGGRSIIILVTLPTLFLCSIYNTRSFKIILGLSAITFMIFIAALTVLRREGSEFEGGILQIVDWEYGRYSMVAYAIDFVSRNEVTYMHNYFDAMIKVILSPIYLLGLGASYVGDTQGSTTHLVGNDILGEFGSTYIVPGALPEAYINLSLPGVVLLGLTLGILIKYISNSMIVNKEQPVVYIFFSYLGAVFCFNFINSTFYALLNYIFFIGLPVTSMYAYTLLVNRFVRLRRKVPHEVFS